MGRGGVLFLDIKYLFSSNYFIFRVFDLNVFFFSWLNVRTENLHFISGDSTFLYPTVVS